MASMAANSTLSQLANLFSSVQIRAITSRLYRVIMSFFPFLRLILGGPDPDGARPWGGRCGLFLRLSHYIFFFF